MDSIRVSEALDSSSILEWVAAAPADGLGTFPAKEGSGIRLPTGAPRQRIWDRQRFIRAGRLVQFKPLVLRGVNWAGAQARLLNAAHDECGLRLVRSPPWSRSQEARRRSAKPENTGSNPVGTST